MTSSPTPMTRGYIMTLCGGLCWAIGGACGQVMFRDCGVTSDWLVPIRLFTGGIITLLIAALTGGKPLEPVRCRDAWPSLLVFALLGSALCQYSYYTSVQYANVAFATVLSSIEPVGSVVISVLFLNTTFSWPDILGFFLILVTISIMAIGKAKDA